VAESRVFRDAGEAAVAAAEAALAAGGLVVFPTDTVFGLAAHPAVPMATHRVFAAKQRTRELTLPVLVADVERARDVAVFDDRAEALAATYWPGAVTLVLPRTKLSRGWDLGEEVSSVGVRMPDHSVARSVLERTGPLAVTSANRSGDPTPGDCEGVVRALGDTVAIYLCGGSAPGGVASTVVDLTGAEARVLRSGALPPGEIESALPEGSRTEGAPEGLG
jgi:tRNA threonylcarbamoyl adenosine modification protein (Sua5/YciO/YrdC/YwlC family)